MTPPVLIWLKSVTFYNRDEDRPFLRFQGANLFLAFSQNFNYF